MLKNDKVYDSLNCVKEVVTMSTIWKGQGMPLID